jgi:hypothetical protein
MIIICEKKFLLQKFGHSVVTAKGALVTAKGEKVASVTANQHYCITFFPFDTSPFQVKVF